MNRLATWLMAAWLTASASIAFALNTGPEEFVGPFANWLNVQTTCGATGDGMTDDTTAIQTCIGHLSNSRPVLYFPAPSVCYKITLTLRFNAHLYMQLIGANPATTGICWGGSSGGTMLRINGSAYATIGRLTFNGENSATIDVDQNWDGSTGTFDTENQYPDVVFENAAYGLRCGQAGQGCAETVPLRDTFSNLTTAGIALGNFNALDMFVWYGTFSKDYDGIQNTLGAGNFHAYNSNFFGSTHADLEFQNTGGFNFRWNFSAGSNTFLYSGITGNPCNVNLQGNTILDTVQGASVQIGCLGPMVMIDNVIRSLAVGPVVNLTLRQASLLSVGNTYTVGNPESVRGKNLSFLSTTAPRSAITAIAPTLPGVPPNNRRVITEETPTRTASQIQADINRAASSGNVRPVIHFQAGYYHLASCLTIPANSDIQLIGDGYYSRLIGPGGCATLSGAGPLYATLRDFLIDGGGNECLAVSGIDQIGARIFMEGVNVSSNPVNVSVNGLVNANIEAHDWFEGSASGVGVYVTGPGDAGQGSLVSIFAGATSGSNLSYEFLNGAHAIVRDIWDDNGGGGGQFSFATGGGSITVFGGTINVVNAPAFGFSNFSGNATLLGLGMSGGNGVLFNGGAPKANLLVAAMVGPGQFVVNQTFGSPPPNYAFIQNQNNAHLGTSGEAYLSDQTNFESASFIISALNQARASLPSIPGSPTLPSGATDFRLYRVFCTDAATGFSFAQSKRLRSRHQRSP